MTSDSNSTLPTGGKIKHTCITCGNVYLGTFCNECGEKVFSTKERSLAYFIGTVINAITFLDNRFLRTVEMLFRKPGQLSWNFILGRRVIFLKPISLFFIANLLYFLFPAFNSLNSNLNVQMYMLPHSELVVHMVDKRIKAEDLSIEDFTIRYNQQSTNMAKLILILLVIYFSIPLMLMNYKRERFFYDHLIVSLEICSLIILYIFIGAAWLFKLVVWLAGQLGSNIAFILNDSVSTWVFAVILFYLFYRIERATYSQKWWSALIKAGVLIFAFYFVLQLYRASLFFVTFWSI